MNIIIKPTMDIKEYKNLKIDGLILPLKDYATDYQTYFTLEDIINIRKEFDKKIFIVLNRMFFNKDIESLKKILLKLDQLDIQGIFFYDLAILELKKELNLKTDLVWNATFMVTNYKTCNYYYEKGVKYAVLSNEITFKEAKEIQEKSKINLMFNLIGYPTVANSYRSLITNYNQEYHTNYQKLEIKEKVSQDTYLVFEDQYGTTFKYSHPLNQTKALKELKQINIPYVILNEDLIDHNDFLEILDIIINDKDINKIEKLIGNNRGFFDKETIYKVKKNEK